MFKQRNRVLSNISDARLLEMFNESCSEYDVTGDITYMTMAQSIQDELDLREDEANQPPPGTWADVARGMANIFPDFDWDSWKDEMKEQED